MKGYYTRLCPHSQGYNSTVCIGCGSDLFFCPKCFRVEPDLCENCEREADQAATERFSDGKEAA